MEMTSDASPAPKQGALNLSGQVRGEITLMFMESHGFDAADVLMISKLMSLAVTSSWAPDLDHQLPTSNLLPCLMGILYL